MGLIASAELDLNVVNDAYTVSLSNPVCAIHADFDGSNPQLSNAWTNITVSKGDVTVPFELTFLNVSAENVSIDPSYSVDMDRWMLRLTEIPNDALEGYVAVNIKTEDGYSTDITWRYTVVRESSMLDWIKDWEGTKTKIGDTYLMTPKLFIGTKVSAYTNEDGEAAYDITGVYIGPSSTITGELSPGIYGYKSGEEIFHLNETGGSIGGWSIENGGIVSSNGALKLLADGSIEVRDAEQDVLWAINSDGSAEFAKGQVILHADGRATFIGQIQSSEGKIGRWNIGVTTLSNGHIGLDARTGVIGIAAGDIAQSLVLDDSRYMADDYYKSVTESGGVMMYYNHQNDYGLAGYIISSGEAVKVLSVGSENIIAGWQFDETSLWVGDAKNNTLRGYTTAGITLGTNGLRGQHFYIDNDGAVSFADGKFDINANGNASIAGWTLLQYRLSTNYAALVSDPNIAGLFLSGANISEVATAGLLTKIESDGGIYLMRDHAQASLAAYNSEGTLLFRLSNTQTNVIAGWNFYGSSLYKGTAKDISGEFTLQSGDITLGENGIRGFKWQLNADGSGSVGGGHAWWDSEGNVTLDDTVTLSASSIKSGTIDATLITADKIIANGEAWGLNKDGSGYLANQNIAWDSSGNISFYGSVRSPFKKFVSSANISATGEYTDNLRIVGAGSKSGCYYKCEQLPFNIAQNGRRITITNYQDDGTSATTGVVYIAPDGYYFFDEGIRRPKLALWNEAVELLGIGTDNQFFGWVVMRRVDLLTESAQGTPARIVGNGYAQVRYNSIRIKYFYSFDGNEYTLNHLGTGMFELVFPSSWGFQQEIDYTVSVVAISEYDNEGTPIFATLKGKGPRGFQVYITKGDGTLINGSFEFTIFRSTIYNYGDIRGITVVG